MIAELRKGAMHPEAGEQLRRFIFRKMLSRHSEHKRRACSSDAPLTVHRFTRDSPTFCRRRTFASRLGYGW